MKAWLICGQSLIFGGAIRMQGAFILIKDFMNFAVQQWNCYPRSICYDLASALGSRDRGARRIGAGVEVRRAGLISCGDCDRIDRLTRRSRA